MSIKPPQLQTAGCEAVNIEGMVALFSIIGDLRVRIWFGTFGTLTVDEMFGPMFINRYICRIFPPEQNIVL